MKTYFVMLLVILPVLAVPVTAQDLPAPDDYSLDRQASGDLDKDGVPEIAAVFYRPLEDDNNSTFSDRVIRIYKKADNGWKLWRKSKWAIYHSTDGGMYPDPLREMRIEDGILIIKHYGGTSWKWSGTNRYRFQNNRFALIGYTSYAGKEGSSKRYMDFNLSTGKIIFKKTTYNFKIGGKTTKNVEKEILYRKGLTINLRNRYSVRRKIETPDGHTLRF